MFIHKKRYYLIIESIKDINLRHIKKRDKFTIIYRNSKKTDEKEILLKFRKNCRLKSIDFYVANNLKLATELDSDGIYLSAYNKSFKALALKNNKFHIIGSAHTIHEACLKIQQGCDWIIFSKLFLVKYDKKSSFLGINRFNNFLKIHNNLIPLGGINLKNLNFLNIVNSVGFAIMSEIKKKPTKIFSRLF